MPHRQEQRLRVAAARADFLDGGLAGAAGVSDLLAASWVRSRGSGVASENPVSDYLEVDTGSRLVRCAQPVISQLWEDSRDLSISIALTDQRARVLTRVDTSPAVGRLLDRVDFAPGFSYAESTMGTNGVGTVLEAGQSVAVVGPEHFSESLQPFACTGAAIVDPVTGRVEGVLDLSTMSDFWSPLMHSLVKSAAKDISRNLLLDRSQVQQSLFETYLRVEARHAKDAVFAFGDSIFMANDVAQQQFSPTEQLAVREYATFLMSRRHKVSDTMALASGRVVQIRGTRLVSGDSTAGMVVIASRSADSALSEEFHEESLPNVAVAGGQTRQVLRDLRTPPSQIAAGTSPVWVRACIQLRRALIERDQTVVVGETGSGKFTLIGELFHDIYPHGRSVCIDAENVPSIGQEDLEAILMGGPDPTLCILRNIDRLDTDAVSRVEVLLRAADRATTAFVSATLSDSSLESDLPFTTLLPYFASSVAIPPLRCRTDDLPSVVTRVLSDIAPGRQVRLSPAAARLIASYTWPRNVRQLQDALIHALRQRPVGEIQAEDLPGYCHTTARHALSPLQAAERDAIISALNEHGGNRKAAATHLGMSRSSLYRKLRSYGIRA